MMNEFDMLGLISIYLSSKLIEFEIDRNRIEPNRMFIWLTDDGGSQTCWVVSVLGILKTDRRADVVLGSGQKTPPNQPSPPLHQLAHLHIFLLLFLVFLFIPLFYFLTSFII